MSVSNRLLRVLGIGKPDLASDPDPDASFIPSWKCFEHPSVPVHHYPRNTILDLPTLPCPPYSLITPSDLLDSTMDLVYRTYEDASIDRKHFAHYALPSYSYAAWLFGPLPASQFDHHAYSGGLFSHSVDVALRAIQLLEGTTIEREPIASHAEYDRYYWPATVILAALMHDVGKISTDMLVYHPDIETTVASGQLTSTFVGVHHSKIWFPEQSSIYEWLRTFREGHQHCRILWRPNRNQEHNRVRDAFIRDALKTTNHIKMNRKYWGALLDPASETGRRIWEIVHEADRASAAAFHRVSPSRPELVVTHILAESIRLGHLRIGDNFGRMVGPKIFLKFPDDLSALLPHLRAHPDFSVLHIHSDDLPDSIPPKLALLLRAAKVIETAPDGSPYIIDPDDGPVIALTDAFSSQLHSEVDSTTATDLSDLGDPIPTVSSNTSVDAPLEPSDSPDANQPRPLPPDQTNSPPNHISQPSFMACDPAQLSVPTDVLPPLICLFLEFLAEQCQADPPPEMTLSDWEHLDEVPNCGLFFHQGVALYVQRFVVESFTNQRRINLTHFLGALQSYPTVVASLHPPPDTKQRATLIVLTREVSGCALQNRLHDFYAFLERSTPAPKQPALPFQLTGFARDLVSVAYTKERAGDELFAPYSLDDSRGLLSSSILQWLLYHDDSIYTRTYGLSPSNLQQKLTEHGLEATPVDNGMALPYRFSDYYGLMAGDGD